jgi:DNA-directed RNA polymerase subunit RPC12/RpoP
MNAFCANCGAEVESEDPLGKKTETYTCKTCGTRGTITRKATQHPFDRPAGKGEPMTASLSLNILDLIKLEAGPERARCPACGSYFPQGADECPSCAQAGLT